MTKLWYEAKTGSHQGLVVEEETGRNVAVTYDKADATLIVAAHNNNLLMREVLQMALVQVRQDNDERDVPVGLRGTQQQIEGVLRGFERSAYRSN
jgi:hypothetical protein